MATILRLDSSSRTAGSHSRALGDCFEREWLARHPADTIVRRDLYGDPVPHIPGDTIAGFFAPQADLSSELRAATALSDELIAELLAADVLLITAPAYNFTVPSTLKAWVDHVVRIGHTFEYTAEGVNGLAGGRSAYLLHAYGTGGYLDDGPLADHDFLAPYLRLVLGFIGIVDVHQIAVEATTADEDTVRGGTEVAERCIRETIAGREPAAG